MVYLTGPAKDVVSQNSQRGQLQNFQMFLKNCVKIILQNVTKIIAKLRLHFEAKNVPRTCERHPVLCFIFLQNSKQGRLQNFRMYQKYPIEIVSKKLRNTLSNTNFNQIYNYNYGMQGLRFIVKSTFSSKEYKNRHSV